MSKQSTDQTLLAEEATALLGIKRATLYSYVSRGLIRTVPDPNEARRQRYFREDVEKLMARQAARAGHTAVASDALNWGQPVLDSAISNIEDGGLLYRGYSFHALLAEGCSYEEVAQLLWAGELMRDITWPESTLELPKIAQLDLAASPLGRLAVAIPRLAALDPSPFPTSARDVRQKAASLIPDLAHLALEDQGEEDQGEEDHLSSRSRSPVESGSTVSVSTASRIARSLGRSGSAQTGLIEAALVSCADHGLNASTFAVRVVASTGADIYGCLSAGLAALSGPRHGGATLRFGHLVSEAGRADHSAQSHLGEKIGRGEVVPGFGHPLYPGGDPRGRELIRRARTLGGEDMKPLEDLLDAARYHGLPAPTLDAGLVAVALALGQRPAFGQLLFALGRMSGWVAHMIEQQSDGRLLRPRARYTGPRSRPVR